MGQSDWARLELSQILQESAFKRLEETLVLSLDAVSLFRGWSGDQCTKKLPLVEYGEVKSKLGSELEVYV